MFLFRLLITLRNFFFLLGWQNLIMKCTNVLQMSDSIVYPRIEIIEQSTVTLLNLAEWETLVTLPTDKRLVICDLATNFAFACQDIVKFKGGKKVARDIWDLSKYIKYNINQKIYVQIQSLKQLYKMLIIQCIVCYTTMYVNLIVRFDGMNLSI